MRHDERVMLVMNDDGPGVQGGLAAQDISLFRVSHWPHLQWQPLL
jgi:hypothetical protein